MHLSMLFSLLCIYHVSQAQNFWDFFKKFPQDCYYTAWVPGDCERSFKTHGSPFIRERTRSKSPALHGGTECKVEPLVDTEDCTLAEFQASILLNNVAQAGYDSGFGSRSIDVNPWAKPKPPKIEDNLCSPNIVVNGQIIALGRKCTAGQGRRRRETLLRREKRQGNQGTFTKKKRDLLILVDESGSVGEAKFGIEMRVAKAIINSLCGSLNVDKFKTRVGLNTFDEITHEYVDFDDYFTKYNLVHKLNTSVKYDRDTAGATCVYNNLVHSNKKMFIKERGSRIQDLKLDTEGMILLITDGCANCNTAKLKEIAQDLYAKKITIMVIWVTNGKNLHCISNLQKLSSGTHCYSFMKIDGWTNMTMFAEAIEQQPCMDQWRFARNECV